jgi:hypothetical protein
MKQLYSLSMKNLRLLTTAFIVFAMAGCNGDISEENTPADGVVAKVPPSYFNTAKNFRKVIPGKPYDYWALIEAGYGSRATVLYEQGNKAEADGINRQPKGVHADIFAPVPEGYVFAVKDKKPHYFSSPEQLTGFLGKIDNIEEAHIVAAYYGFVPDSTLQANTYYRKGSNYVLRLTNHHGMPDAYYTDEVLDVTVTNDGFIKTRSVWKGNAKRR